MGAIRSTWSAVIAGMVLVAAGPPAGALPTTATHGTSSVAGVVAALTTAPTAVPMSCVADGPFGTEEFTETFTVSVELPERVRSGRSFALAISGELSTRALHLAVDGATPGDLWVASDNPSTIQLVTQAHPGGAVAGRVLGARWVTFGPDFPVLTTTECTAAGTGTTAATAKVIGRGPDDTGTTRRVHIAIPLRCTEPPSPHGPRETAGQITLSLVVPASAPADGQFTVAQLETSLVPSSLATVVGSITAPGASPSQYVFGAPAGDGPVGPTDQTFTATAAHGDTIELRFGFSGAFVIIGGEVFAELCSPVGSPAAIAAIPVG